MTPSRGRETTNRAPVRIAMWSGPRNVSTALMRSFENRGDTAVCDEPLYGYYLATTRAPHPGAHEVVAHHEIDWRRVVKSLTGPVPQGKEVFYQKHMAQHLLPEIDRTWLESLEHCFLIRHPAEMLTSLDEILPHPRLADTGLPQQVEIFERVRRRNGHAPPVVDSRDLLRDPESILTRLCEELGLTFSKGMLRWPPGSRATDGIWAKHWYHNVERSTRFRPFRPKARRVPDHLSGLYSRCMEYYERLRPFRLTA